MRRYVIAFLSMAAGCVVAAILVAVELPHVQRAPNPGPIRPGTEEYSVVMDACVTIFFVAYTCGRFLYQRLGAAQDLKELEMWSSGHLAMLHAMGGFWMIRPVLNDPPGKWLSHLSVWIGLVMILAAVRDCWHYWKSRRNGRTETHPQP